MRKKFISFQGLEGAYSDLVCRKYYKGYETIPCYSFEQAINTVEKRKAEIALIPVENNIAGRVADMHFLLENINLKVIAEHYHKIEHHLMTKRNLKLTDVKKVFSHIHALGQCKNNIRKLKLQANNFIDTAGAAKFVSESSDNNVAAIASKLASEIYDLKIIKKNFQDSKNNITRFLVFSRKSKKISTKKKVITSVVFNTKNLPASLYKALGGFASNSINLTRLESFFVNKDFKQFSFLIDVESHPDSPTFKKALEVLNDYSTKVRILGYFEASDFRV
ncbi:MAG: prephenate dehydratase [alpha proteobacterium MED-G10]|nr:MAG: prephenate dehydratase [alpha proteobacterium MED-G10]|tara:strand:+ start:738 stop:1571 length:834 start_codon:yes stop_codon:yes gene_type:complete